MSRPAWAGAALLSSGVLLLTTTQPWVRTVTEVAPGAPRSRGEVGALELVPWLAPVALVVALAVVAGLAGMRWARPVAVAAAAAALAAVSTGILKVAGAGAGPVAGAAVVTAAPTGWLWVGAASAVLTAGATVAWVWPHPGRTDPPGEGGAEDAAGSPPGGVPGKGHEHADEALRRQDDRAWRELTEGRDPTDP